MASVRDTIFEMLTEYPSLFKTKASCYRHLFLVNGNGYDWVNGELIAWNGGNSEPDFKDEDEEIAQRTKDSEHIGNTDWIRLEVRRNNQAIQFAIDNIDIIYESEMLMFGHSSSLHYSGWEYCKLMQVPEDVKPDWREAIMDVMFALIPYINQSLDFDVRKVEETKALARDLQRLKEEKFPDVIRSDAEMKKFLTKILGDKKT